MATPTYQYFFQPSYLDSLVSQGSSLSVGVAKHRYLNSDAQTAWNSTTPEIKILYLNGEGLEGVEQMLLGAPFSGGRLVFSMFPLRRLFRISGRLLRESAIVQLRQCALLPTGVEPATWSILSWDLGLKRRTKIGHNMNQESSSIFFFESRLEPRCRHELHAPCFAWACMMSNRRWLWKGLSPHMLTFGDSRAQIARRGRRWCLTGDSQVAHKRIHVMTHTSIRSHAAWQRAVKIPRF